MSMKIFIFIFAAFLSTSLFAEESLAKDLRFGAFLDTYYAFDFNNPKDHEREFTTQPVRHNEFAVNLAYIEAVLRRDKVRSRLALQYGNSVTKNTATEPKVGATSGPEHNQIFQEAYVGTRVGLNTWIDMGIFLGNIGSESWISKDNWTYTRALFLDYVPYYSAGVRLEHKLGHAEAFQVQLLNGWSNMSENNQGKAIGMQYTKAYTEKFTFTYNNFFGDEEVVSTNPRFRGYHDFIFKWLYSDEWQYLYSIDVGHQSQQTNDGVNGWMATALTVRHVLNSTQALAFRTEYYNDTHQSNVLTGTPNGFHVVGASVNFDQQLDHKAMWRTELRGFHSEDKIYPQGNARKNRLDGFLVTSLSIWL